MATCFSSVNNTMALVWQAGCVSSLIPCTVTRHSKVSNRSTSDWESELQMLFLAGNLVYIHMKYSLNFFVGLTQDHTKKYAAAENQTLKHQ